MASGIRSKQDRRSLVVAAHLLSFTLIVAFLYFAKIVLIPLILAIMLTFVLGPVVMWIERRGVGRVWGVMLTVTLATLLIVGLLATVVLQLNTLVNDLPNHSANIQQKIASLRTLARDLGWDRLRAALKELGQAPLEEQLPADPRSANFPPADFPRELPAEHLPVPTRPVPTRIVPEEGIESFLMQLFSSLQAISPALEVLTTIGLALILSMFMLVRREDVRNRLVSFSSLNSLATTTKALDDAARRISRYLIMQLILNGSFGFAIGWGLYFIGVPYALLWGLCAAAFRYIPYIGPWIAIIFPLAISFITSPGWSDLLLIFGCYLLLEIIVANVLEPLLYGQGTGVSELAILISATFWAWLWGPVGLILSTPLTVCVVVAGKHVPSLAFFDRLLGHQAALKPHAAYLQRLLARDQREATHIVRDYCRENSPETVYDNVFIPALSMMRQDRVTGEMTAEEEDYILQQTRPIMEEVRSLIEPDLPASTHADSTPKSLEETAAASKAASTASATGSATAESPAEATELADRKSSRERPQGGLMETPPADIRTGYRWRADSATAAASHELRAGVRIFGVAAHHEVEELTLDMLDHLVQPLGLHVEVFSTRTLPSEIVDEVGRQKPGLVFIAALPPGGLPQAVYLCNQLHKAFPELAIVAGYWGQKSHLDRIIQKLRSAGANYVTTTVLAGRSHLLSMLREPPSPPAPHHHPPVSQSPALRDKVPHE